MDMQDKDMDELFRSKLDDLETESSAKVWPAIAAGLDAAGRRKSVAPFLGIAASLLILAAAGALLIPQKKVAVRKPPGSNVIVKAVQPGIKSRNAGSTLMPATAAPIVKTPVNAVRQMAMVPEKKANRTDVIKNTDTIATQNIPAKTDEPLLAASVIPTPQGNSKPVVPDNRTSLSVKLNDNVSPAFATKPILIATGRLPAIQSSPAPVKARRRIRSLGDLVNLVVAKVNKRNNNVIEEDGESNIIGVNLGVLKLNKGDE